jgi:hypothetical protein
MRPASLNRAGSIRVPGVAPRNQRSFSSFAAPNQAEEEEEERLMCGYLFKKGRGFTLGFFKPWRYRWFTLNIDTGILRYYEDDFG